MLIDFNDFKAKHGLFRHSLIHVKIGSGEPKRLFVIMVSPSMNLETAVNSKLVNSTN